MKLALLEKMIDFCSSGIKDSDSTAFNNQSEEIVKLGGIECPPQKSSEKKVKSAKEDPMTCVTFTIRTSMLAKLQEFANDEQADSGELNLSRYVRGIFKRHIDKREAAQQKDTFKQ